MAMADAIRKAFVWGENGAQLTPEDIAKRREIADALTKSGMDYSPVASPWQGAARVAQGVLGALDERDLNTQSKANASYNDELVNGLLGGVSSSPAASAATSGVQQQLSASSPSPASAPAFANDGTELGGYLSDPARRATLPAGMRNNNPGNIKFVGQNVPGIVGPSVNTDQGDPQAVFATPEAGMSAMHALLAKKYAGGKVTPNQMIAGNMGWTPGNYQAAANVARTMGIGPDDDIGFSDPSRAARFMQGLILQEHGKSGQMYPLSMIQSSIGGQPVQVASAQPQTASDAIAAYAPGSGTVDPGQAAIATAAPQAVQPPIQVAQASPAPTGANPAIIRALTDPRASESTRAVARAYLQQQMSQQNAAMSAQQEQQTWEARQRYQKQQQDSDPLRQLQIREAQIKVDSSDKKPLMNAGDGRIYNPNDGSWIQAPNAASQFRQATPEEAQKYGVPSGQFGPDGKFYPVNPPSGTSLSVDPQTGAVTFNQGAGVKPLTEGQSKDSFFTTRMSGAMPTIDKFEQTLTSLPEAAAGAIPMNLGRYAQSEEYQLAKDAGRDFVTAYLRKDSGAAITPDEERLYNNLLLPQPGDKPAILSAKRQRRALAVEAIKSGMPSNAVDGMLRAIHAVPGADEPAKTSGEIQTDIPGVTIRRKN